MSLYPIKRTPEEGHTKKCLAKAMISAIENWRDDTSINDSDFISFAQGYGMDYGVLATAYEYLNTGTTICLCEPISLTNIFDQVKHFGNTQNTQNTLSDDCF